MIATCLIDSNITIEQEDCEQRTDVSRSIWLCPSLLLIHSHTLQQQGACIRALPNMLTRHQNLYTVCTYIHSYIRMFMQGRTHMHTQCVLKKTWPAEQSLLHIHLYIPLHGVFNTFSQCNGTARAVLYSWMAKLFRKWMWMGLLALHGPSHLLQFENILGKVCLRHVFMEWNSQPERKQDMYVCWQCF